MEYTLNFRLEFSSQQYNTMGAHDQCFILMAAATDALLNKRPIGSGFEIEDPLMLLSEDFMGITDNSQFVYKQLWSIKAIIRKDCLPVDPCVRRGFTGLNFRNEVLLTIPRSHVIDNLGRVYTLDPDGSLLNEDDNCNVKLSDGTTILTADQYVMQGAYNDNGYLVSIHIMNADDTVHETRPAYLTKYYLLRLTVGLYRNLIVDDAQYDTTILPYLNNDINKFPVQLYKYARTLYDTYFYFDPSNSNANKVTLNGGQLIMIRPNITMIIDDITYVKAYLIDGSEGYVIEQFILAVGSPEE